MLFNRKRIARMEATRPVARWPAFPSCTPVCLPACSPSEGRIACEWWCDKLQVKAAPAFDVGSKRPNRRQGAIRMALRQVDKTPCSSMLPWSPKTRTTQYSVHQIDATLNKYKLQNVNMRVISCTQHFKRSFLEIERFKNMLISTLIIFPLHYGPIYMEDHSTSTVLKSND